MGYDRRYEPEEVHQMLYLSERRPSPAVAHGKGPAGHAISMHSEQRENPFDRRRVARDSAFASRRDLVLAVHEALNHPVGQLALGTLNAHEQQQCRIVVNLSLTLGKIKAHVVQNPMTPSGKPAQGPPNYLTQQLVTSVFVYAIKVHAAESWAPLHIQTAYPVN